MKYASRIYICLIFAILYMPIATLILFSFNGSDSTAEFVGVSFKWYVELFSSIEAFTALRNTLILAVLSSLIATLIGTAAAEGIYKMRSKLLKTAIKSVTNIPMMNPDIVTGMSMMLFFAAVMAILPIIGDYNNIGFLAMLISHVTFCLPYVILSVLPRITELGDTISESALDLGCTPLQAFFKVKLPNIMPAVLSGMVMAFTLSLDDFVISYFVAPSDFQTLPLLIYSMTKKKVKPDMYALSTIIIVTVFILLLISNFKSDKKSRKHTKRKRIAAVVALSVAFVTTGAILISSMFVGEVKTLNVYNWGEYISDGSEDTFDVNRGFAEYYEEKHPGVKVIVNYSTYPTNEDMYSKLKNSAVAYDVIIPSDYMIERLISEGMLQKLDFGKIDNYDNISDDFKSLYYDCDGEGGAAEYSVPYTYGMMGIVYNADEVDREYIEERGWGILWDENYAGNILQFNNPRDAFATAMFKLGLDINSDNAADWELAFAELEKQKPILQGYVNDEIFDKMTSGSALIAPYYVGDYLTMIATDGAANLAFYFPDEGVNYFVDAMCIPANAKDPELAMEYINYMLTEEAAIANATYIAYASPNKLVVESDEYSETMLDWYGEDWEGNPAHEILNLLPNEVNKKYNELFSDKKDPSCYRSFSPEIQEKVNELWESLKLSSTKEIWLDIVSVTIVLSVSGLGIYSVCIKKWRSRHYRKRDKLIRKEKALKNNLPK